MASLNRRDFLKLSAGAVGTTVLVTDKASAEGFDRNPFNQNVAMLNDCAKCIGCRGCQAACKKLYQREQTIAPGDYKVPKELYDMPFELNAKNFTVIKMFRDEKGKNYSFIKRQCLHCNKPSCVSVCPVAALRKNPPGTKEGTFNIGGVVNYDKDRCIGCRYCVAACPFDVPVFEYDKVAPTIAKCEFCEEKRLKKGEQPECVTTCPVGAIKFGTREELLKEAKERIKQNPEKYTNHVYGETEVGGTSVLYLAKKEAPFEKIGLKLYDEEPVPALPEAIQDGIFKYFIPPVALFGALALIRQATKNKDSEGGEK